MHLTTSTAAVLPLLLSTVSAATLPAHVRRQDNTTTNGESSIGKNDVAGGHCQKDLTKDVWTKGYYSDSMQDLLYAGPSNGDQWGDKGWRFSQILSLDPKKKPELKFKGDKSVVEVIRSWAKRVDEFSCTNKDFNAGCNSLDLGSKENCETVEEQDNANVPQAVIMLKNIANFANAMTDATGTLNEIRDSIKTKGTEIHETFALNPEDGNSKSAAGPLGHSAGYIAASSVAGLWPGVGALLGGVLGIFIAANGAVKTTAYEPKFERNDEFEGFVDETSGNIVEIVRRGVNAALNDAPNLSSEDDIKNWIDGDGSLLSILRNGDYADAKSQSIGDSGRDNLKKILYSFAINREMKASQNFVVRIGKDQAAGMGLDENKLCEDEGYPGFYKYCESDGSISLVMRYHWQEEKTAVKGFDKLTDYNIDIRDVARNSWAWQQVNGFGDGQDKWEQNSANVLERGLKGDDATNFQHWDLPVCDIGTWTFPDGKAVKSTDKVCKDHENPAKCAIIINSVCRCKHMGGWPLGKAPWPPMPVVSLFSNPDVDPKTKLANAWIDACEAASGEKRKDFQGKQVKLDDP